MSSSHSENWSFSPTFCFLSSDRFFVHLNSFPFIWWKRSSEAYDNKVELSHPFGFNHRVGHRAELSPISLGRAQCWVHLLPFTSTTPVCHKSRAANRDGILQKAFFSFFSVVSGLLNSSPVMCSTALLPPTKPHPFIGQILGTWSLKSKNFSYWNVENAST